MLIVRRIILSDFGSAVKIISGTTKRSAVHHTLFLPRSRLFFLVPRSQIKLRIICHLSTATERGDWNIHCTVHCDTVGSISAQKGLPGLVMLGAYVSLILVAPRQDSATPNVGEIGRRRRSNRRQEKRKDRFAPSWLSAMNVNIAHSRSRPPTSPVLFPLDRNQLIKTLWKNHRRGLCVQN